MTNHTTQRLGQKPRLNKATMISALRTLTAPNALLWKMLAVAVAAHILLLLFTTPSLFGSRADSVDQLYERGEAAMKAGHYTEATEIFQRVLDAQPKPAPIFIKAADQHKNAEKLAKQQAGAPMTPAPQSNAPPAGTASGSPAAAGAETASPRPATHPTFVPSELRPK